MNAATRSPIAVIMSPIGFTAIAALSPVMTVFTAVIADVTFGMTVRIVPTDVISFPMTMSTGPTAAAISAIFTMVSCMGPGIEFQISANF